jgi:hypothetical protein
MTEDSIFISLSLLTVMLAKAQPYQRCLDGGIVRWSMLDYHEICGSGIISTEFIAWGDTLINNISYKKMHYTGEIDISVEESNENWKRYIPDWNIWNRFYWEHYYIRESADASKLYLYNTYEDEEYLISDISLQKGDEFYYFNQSYIVDSVYIQNERKHVRMNREIWSPINGGDSLIFIEGVGPNIWQLYPWEIESGSLNCFQNQTSFYKYEKADYPCGYFSMPDAIESVYKNKNYDILIQKDKVKILFPSSEDREIFIYDIHGLLHYTGRSNRQQEIIVPAAHYAKGIYLLKILNKNTNQMNINKIIL